MSISNQTEINLVRKNTFDNEVIIVDGQGRSGKNLIAVLLSTMPRVEKMRLDSQVDYIPRYHSLGKMSEDATIVALRTEFDEKLYYNSISRDINFRLSDYTGVFKQGKRWIYIKRLFQKADSEAVERIRKEKPIFQEMTHDGIQFIDIYFKALYDRLKFIHILRHPVHNIYEQNNRDFGTRIGVDPRELQLTYEWNDHIVPLMAMGREELWINGAPLERLVVIVETMFRKNLESLKALPESYSHRVLILEFEQFVQHPYKDMARLEKFIGQSFGIGVKRILKRERCPRIIPEGQLAERTCTIRAAIRKEYQLIFDQMLNDYEKFII